MKEPALAVGEPDQTDEESFSEQNPVWMESEIITEIEIGLDAIQELLDELRSVRDLKEKQRKARREKT